MKLNLSIKAIQLIFVFISITLISIFATIFYSNKHNLEFKPFVDSDKIYDGYVLYSTINLSYPPFKSGKVYLVYIDGKIVHLWDTIHRPLKSLLKKNGNLVTSLMTGERSEFPSGGLTPIIQELDWKGNVLWEYNNEAMHHDFDILPNENIAAVIWEKIPEEIAEKIQGGIPNTEYNGAIFSDSIIEVNKQGKIVWTWQAYQHLDPQKDALNPLDIRQQWTTINSIRYVEKDPFYNDEAYLVSMRSLSAIFLIQRKTGQIIWRSSAKMLDHQHDPSLLSNGNILVFDNGFYPRADLDLDFGSRVIEIDPKQNKIVWNFNGGFNPIDQAGFWSPILGGAQRLPNGNTLIVNGIKGQLIEVSPDKKIVWNYTNIFTEKTNGPFPSNFIFKAQKYSLSDIIWPDKNLKNSKKSQICHNFFEIFQNHHC